MPYFGYRSEAFAYPGLGSSPDGERPKPAHYPSAAVVPENLLPVFEKTGPFEQGPDAKSGRS